MSYYIEYIHICCSNIILLLFILTAIGHILQDDNNNTMFNKHFIKYYSIVFIVLIVTGCIMLFNNTFWISFPIFKYKLIMVLLLISLSVIYYVYEKKLIYINPIFLIISFISVYSLSILIGRYANK